MLSKKPIITVVISLFGAALVLFFWLRSGEHGAQDHQTPVVVKRPTLYCEFYNFMHNATVVSFDFAVGQDTKSTPLFTELFVREADGTQTNIEPDASHWEYAVDDGSPTITSPDATTRIVLYGLKPTTAGVFWTEAGIRSNTYRNLEGKCRQAHLDRAARTGS